MPRVATIFRDKDCASDQVAECPGENRCVEGRCAEPCGGGVFSCPMGLVCINNLCIENAVIGSAGSGNTGPDNGRAEPGASGPGRGGDGAGEGPRGEGGNGGSNGSGPTL